MKIAFYLAEFGTVYDKLIAFATNSIYSHCEIVLSDGKCWSSSARDGGVRFKYIPLKEHWHVFDLTGIYDELQVNYWFSLHEDNKYDFIGAVGSVFGLDFTSNDRQFCSEVCADVLGINPAVTPAKLLETLKNNNFIK